jgi:hypothetical protein
MEGLLFHKMYVVRHKWKGFYFTKCMSYDTNGRASISKNVCRTTQMEGLLFHKLYVVRHKWKGFYFTKCMSYDTNGRASISKNVCRTTQMEGLLFHKLYVVRRVTRWVCEKIAQNAAQDIFLSKLIHNLNSLKRGPKMWAISVIFKVTTQSYQLFIGRIFAQSGHPGPKTRGLPGMPLSIKKKTRSTIHPFAQHALF